MAHFLAWRIEVAPKSGAADPGAQSLLRAARSAELAPLRSLRSLVLRRGFLLPPQLSRAEIDRSVAALLRDDVVEDVAIEAPNSAAGSSATDRTTLTLYVRRRNGVMDPVANSLTRALRVLHASGGKDLAGVQTYQRYDFSFEGAPGQPELEAARELARRGFANETIEELLLGAQRPEPHPPAPPYRYQRLEIPIRALDETALAALSTRLALALDVAEMRTVQSYFQDVERREPSDCELLTLAQTWSEHCKHKTLTGRIEYRENGGAVQRFENMLKETIFAATQQIDAPWCLSVFADNAGVIELDERYGMTFKVETHNHPSAIEPYGGAGTGIGGVLRDTLGTGLGARPIASTDVFCVGPLDLPREQLPPGTLHPRRILEGVVSGVRDYGNRMGVPTVNGAVYVDPAYVGNPLVYCGNIGLIPRDKIRKQPERGDLVVALGGRTGRDGIGGATFSSVELHEESEVVSATAVQIGDPITEKKVADLIVRARDRELFHALTDCGAGGFSSAVGEMGEELGADIELQRAPLKYQGLSYAEIWISEAQERMVAAVPPTKLAELLELCREEEVEATVIGTFTGTGRLRLSYDGQLVADLAMSFLHKGLPKRTLQATWSAPELRDPEHAPPGDFGQLLHALLRAPNICSKEWIIRGYDHEVQGASVVKPLVGPCMDGPSDAAVIAPLSDSRRGVAVGCGMNPRYGAIDPAAMAGAAIDEALRNIVCVGGDPERTAILDNFSWGSCKRPERLGALVRAAIACREIAVALGTPFISGKDSLNNEYRVGDRTIVIPDTLLISAISVMSDVGRAVTMDWKSAGNALYLVGETRRELGGSHLLLVQELGTGASVPRLDPTRSRATLRALHGAITTGLVRSAHDLSEGGLLVAAAEMAFAGRVGGSLDLRSVPRSSDCERDDWILGSESLTRFLVEVAPEQTAAFERALAGCVHARIGSTDASGRLILRGLSGATLLDEALEGLQASHAAGMEPNLPLQAGKRRA
ncbi:MAG: phosphoribosylformylglycinamidine synthase subunit PurL [Planctomycetes bacterium]|nr:phosphoribosylformylglycinamidine synthase subunit PurL [Planctomycetota bacterium]